MFEIEQFVADCRQAVAGGGGQKAVQELTERAVHEPGPLMKALGEPKQAGVNKIYHSDTLTILNLVWGPYMTLKPHNHNMWACIGIYTGREDNIFWRRIAGEEGPQVEAAGADALQAGQCAPLGRDIIHSVTNPIPA